MFVEDDDRQFLRAWRDRGVVFALCFVGFLMLGAGFFKSLVLAFVFLALAILGINYAVTTGAAIVIFSAGAMHWIGLWAGR